MMMYGACAWSNTRCYCVMYRDLFNFVHTGINTDYTETRISLIFSPTVDIIQPQVAIINDEINENSENFFVMLVASQDEPSVNISQGRAMITILDDFDRMFAYYSLLYIV